MKLVDFYPFNYSDILPKQLFAPSLTTNNINFDGSTSNKNHPPNDQNKVISSRIKNNVPTDKVDTSHN